ncbi:MAG: alpha/beta hydrolase, partial [Variibacter sp.]|nr:alpha/beta hydrolase [Variibacter sp.]
MTKAAIEAAIDQGIHRFLADGVHYRDLMDIRVAAPDWKAWPETWSKWAEEAEKRGEAALAANAKLTAATEFARASLYYHYGQYMLFDDLALKKRIHDKKRDSFKRAAPLFEVPMERVEIPFDGIRMAAYFRVPAGVKKPPCVILLGGLDTTKEDYLTVADLCLKRGLATLAFDGPGQGETLFEMRWRTDFERAVVAAIDYLETRPEIDRDRIGIIGRSMGGCYAPKTAAIDKRIKALVAWGAMYHLRNLAEVPKHTLEGFMFVSNSRTLEEAKNFYASVDLSRYAPKITCPTLVVHGGLDTITPMDNAISLAKDVKGPVET